MWMRLASPGLSSISNILILSLIGCDSKSPFLQGEIKCGPFTRLRFHPYFSFMFFYYFFTDSQANAGARVFILCVQALKNDKYLVLVFFLDTNTVIPHREQE